MTCTTWIDDVVNRFCEHPDVVECVGAPVTPDLRNLSDPLSGTQRLRWQLQETLLHGQLDRGKPQDLS